MDRREILAVSGVIICPLAGCIEDTEISGTNDDSLEEGTNDGLDCDSLSSTEPANTPDEGFPSVEILTDDSKRDHIAIQTNLLRHFDKSGPAQMEILVMNDSEEERQFTFHDSAPFPAYTGFQSDEKTGLFVGPESDDNIDFPDEPTDGCWQIDDVPPISDVEATIDLEPCEVISETYRVYHASGEDCLKEGKYRFKVSDMGELGHEWGFTLRLEKK